MLYAKVVVALAVEGPFDYIVPLGLDKRINIGSRVWVEFGARRMPGYVVGLAHKTKIKRLKEILEIIDNFPLLDKNMLLLTRKISQYYCCSLGEAIETALPEDLRKGRKIPDAQTLSLIKRRGSPQADLICDLDGGARWQIYLEEIEKALKNNQSVIAVFADKNAVLAARDAIKTKLDILPNVLYRKQPQELEEWQNIRLAERSIVVGTRSAVFAPVRNLGLMIIDEEEDSVYKQDQTPHYNAREAAFMRIDIEKAKLILGSASPSLESYYLANSGKARGRQMKYTVIPRSRNFPEIKLIDLRTGQRGFKRKNIILSGYLEGAILECLNTGGKALLFLNRKGFATLAVCNNCGRVLKCPRCDINLVYHFNEKELNCHYCNFKMPPSSICPNCNSGYIRYVGAGTQKLESELSRLFPQAKIKRLDGQEAFDIKDADIFIATSSIIRRSGCCFDLIGALSIDNSLNRIDFRSSEKTFALLAGLLTLTEKKFVIQTGVSYHYCFQALLKKDIGIFYSEELKQRKQLHFPPYRHIILVKLRGKKESLVQQKSRALFEKLNADNKTKCIKIISVNPGHPPKLRGNFYWQLLISSSNVKKVNEFLKTELKNFSHSGIIVTVDIDPV